MREVVKDGGGIRWRRAKALFIGLACLPPAIVPVTAEAAPVRDAAAFDRLFVQGEEQYSRREYLAAARTWTEAAGRLPATDRENRGGLYDYIAEAYERAAIGSGDRAVVEEAVKVLDAYSKAFGEAYPGVALGSKGSIAHANLQKRLTEMTQVAEGPQPELPPDRPAPGPAPQGRPWKGLAIGGGAVAGLGLVMFGMFAGGYARSKLLERQFSDDMCTLGEPTPDCQDILGRGRRADVAATTGVIAGPVLLVAGATMIGLAVRRKSSHQSLAPVLGGGLVGAVWRREF